MHARRYSVPTLTIRVSCISSAPQQTDQKTHQWTVYVRSANNEDITHIVPKVWLQHICFGNSASCTLTHCSCVPVASCAARRRASTNSPWWHCSCMQDCPDASLATPLSTSSHQPSSCCQSMAGQLLPSCQTERLLAGVGFSATVSLLPHTAALYLL